MTIGDWRLATGDQLQTAAPDMSLRERKRQCAADLQILERSGVGQAQRNEVVIECRERRESDQAVDGTAGNGHA